MLCVIEKQLCAVDTSRAFLRNRLIEENLLHCDLLQRVSPGSVFPSLRPLACHLPFAHQRRGHVALPNSESAGPQWDPSCRTAPSGRCPGGTVAREDGSPPCSSKRLCRSLPARWRCAFRRGGGGGGEKWAEPVSERLSQAEVQRVGLRLTFMGDIDGYGYNGTRLHLTLVQQTLTGQ